MRARSPSLIVTDAVVSAKVKPQQALLQFVDVEPRLDNLLLLGDDPYFLEQHRYGSMKEVMPA